MPLKTGKSRTTFSENVSAEIKAGRPHKIYRNLVISGIVVLAMASAASIVAAECIFPGSITMQFFIGHLLRGTYTPSAYIDFDLIECVDGDGKVNGSYQAVIATRGAVGSSQPLITGGRQGTRLGTICVAKNGSGDGSAVRATELDDQFKGGATDRADSGAAVWDVTNVVTHLLPHGKIALPPPDRNITTQTFTASGTYNAPQNIRLALVECVSGTGGPASAYRAVVVLHNAIAVAGGLMVRVDNGVAGVASLGNECVAFGGNGSGGGTVRIREMAITDAQNMGISVYNLTNTLQSLLSH